MVEEEFFLYDLYNSKVPNYFSLVAANKYSRKMWLGDE